MILLFSCPVFTPVIQGQLNYDNSLNLAYVEVWAYKFPDQSNLFFQCQISLCGKRENECIGVTVIAVNQGRSLGEALAALPP